MNRPFIKDKTRNLGFKTAVLAALTLIMLIPLGMVKSLISERDYRSDEVEREIIESSGGSLVSSAPVLKLKAFRTEERRVINEDGTTSISRTEKPFSIWLAPEYVDLRYTLDSEERRRGIFSVPVFGGEAGMRGSFNLRHASDLLEKGERLAAEPAVLVLPAGSQKSIASVSQAQLGQQNLKFLPGDKGFGTGSGITAETGILDPERIHEFDISLQLNGGGSVKILPLGGNVSITMTSDWNSPSFRGYGLPSSRKLTEEGFDAEWKCGSMNTGLPEAWKDSPDYQRLEDTGLVTEFAAIHEHYEQNRRAAKYGLLFILIPFITFFLFEIMTGRNIHSIQYILTATANIVFFILLLALSEHIRFNTAYLVSAAATTILVSFYAVSILAAGKKGLILAPVTAAAYLFLFITLQSEDWALLIGSVGVFAVTAFLMLFTRKVDFYDRNKD